MTSRMEWHQARADGLVRDAYRAHLVAAAQAAGLAARAIRSKGTGQLARDVSRPRHVAPGLSQVGSDKVYARVQNDGATITPKRAPRLLIRGKRNGGRSSYGGPIVASAEQVTIKGKKYLDVAVRAYYGLFVAAARRLMR